jgi:hypothetical protein
VKLASLLLADITIASDTKRSWRDFFKPYVVTFDFEDQSRSCGANVMRRCT